MVPVSQVARDKLRLQRGTPLPGREFGLGGPTAHPTCNQKPRRRAAEGGEALDSTVGPTAGAGLVSQGSLRGGQGASPHSRAALPCCAPVSSLPPWSKVSPGIQGSWSGGPTGCSASATPSHVLPPLGTPEREEVQPVCESCLSVEELAGCPGAEKKRARGARCVYVWGWGGGAGCLCPVCDPALEGSCPVSPEGATTKVAGRW